MKNTSKEYTVILYDTSYINSSSVSEADNSSDKYEKTSIAYDSDSDDDEKSSSSLISREKHKWPQQTFVTNEWSKSKQSSKQVGEKTKPNNTIMP